MMIDLNSLILPLQSCLSGCWVRALALALVLALVFEVVRVRMFGIEVGEVVEGLGEGQREKGEKGKGRRYVCCHP
jgi:hypothetical protein